MPRFCGNLEIGAEKCAHWCGSVQSRGSVMGGFARLGSGAAVGAAGLVAGSVGRVPNCQRGRDGLRGARCRQGAKLGNSAGVAAYFGGIGGLVSCRSCFVICELGKRNVRASNLEIWGYWESRGCHALRSWRCDSWGTVRNSVRRLRGYRRRLEEGFTHPSNLRFPGFDCA